MFSSKIGPNDLLKVIRTFMGVKDGICIHTWFYAKYVSAKFGIQRLMKDYPSQMQKLISSKG